MKKLAMLVVAKRYRHFQFNSIPPTAVLQSNASGSPCAKKFAGGPSADGAPPMAPQNRPVRVCQCLQDDLRRLDRSCEVWECSELAWDVQQRLKNPIDYPIGNPW